VRSPLPRPAALAAALALAALPLLVRADAGERMPGPAPSPRRADAARENARCEGCHAEIAAEWRSSLHHRAHTEPAYQRALAIEPLAFCRGCHAPEADPDRDPPADLGALGVGCVSCHAAPGGVLAAPREGAGRAVHGGAASGPTPRALARAPHGVLRSAAFATDAACAACHEFSFPDPARRRRRELMQSTVSEHKSSPFADVPCAGCHMPAVTERGGRTHRSHAFAASRDAALLRSAVRVTASRVGDGTVEVRLAPNGVGHAFPTGDLFRRLEVRAEAVGAEAQVIAEDARYLGRRFGKGVGTDGHPVKVLVADTRVSPSAEAVVKLSLGPGARGAPIAWRVAYQRVEHPVDDASDAAVVAGEVEIARGVLR
jgi:hypothetical protein